MNNTIHNSDKKKSIPIVFSPNNVYTKYFAVTLQSIIVNSDKNYDYNIIVFEKEISTRNKNLLTKMLPANFNIEFININEHIKNYLPNVNLYSKKYWSESMFYRILIPAVLQNYDKVLYLDSDICVNSDLTELFKINFENNALLAIRDEITYVFPHAESRYFHIKNELRLKDPYSYFNSGVLLFNVNKIKSDLDKYLNDLTIALQNDKFLFPDQDLLNIVFEDNTKLISSKWNCTYGSWICYNKKYPQWLTEKDYNEWLKTKENPYILHYTSTQKPWMHPANETAEIFWHYAKQTPFYEEILFENLKKQPISINKNEIENLIRNVTYRRKIYAQYLRCKILKSLTFGKTKKHYIEKTTKLKSQVQNYRKTLGK